ncbi:putative ankyrin repeat protein RF_0381 isoform X2 [Watersipora subatra]|uniref:putative ankyrin repeat protein RF_0381 isoform X2 n=1 Tax=Watersipora subatra TaxID=2589382 RepID=UPI00355B2AEB
MLSFPLSVTSPSQHRTFESTIYILFTFHILFTIDLNQVLYSSDSQCLHTITTSQLTYARRQFRGASFRTPFDSMDELLRSDKVTVPSHKDGNPSHALLRKRLASVKVDQMDENGNTLLHKLVERTVAPTPIYVFAEAGVPINVLNKAGDSVLHVAVKAGKVHIVEALLQCGADVNIANKVGLTPVALCNSSRMQTIMNWFQPGLYQAVTSGDFGAVCKLLKNWVSVSAKTLPGSRSILDLHKSLDTRDVYVLRCLEKLHDSHTQSALVQAVLADNEELVKKLLESTRMRTVNCRYKGERSLLSIALENRNVELVRLLLDNGVKTNGRVRHRHLPEGNTSLIRAIKHRGSLPFIQWYISTSQGQTIAKRNIASLTAYEVAVEAGRTDVTSFINQYITDNMERLRTPLAVQFYGKLHPQLADIHRKVEVNGTELLTAACRNNAEAVISLNLFNYQDRNGFTALHKAVAAANVRVVEELARARPVLKGISDNHGRYPLHMAFLLSDTDVRQEILSLLLQNNPENYEYTTDTNGKNPADYKYFSDDVKASTLGNVLVAPF